MSETVLFFFLHWFEFTFFLENGSVKAVKTHIFMAKGWDFVL